MNTILRSFFGKILKGKVSKNLNKKLKRLKFPSLSSKRDLVDNVGVLQLKYQKAEGLDFVDLIYSVMNQAYQKNVKILFFPGGLQYVFFPSFKENSKYVKYFTENHFNDFVRVFSKMAAGFGINIFTGEFYLYENNEIVRCGMVIDNYGKVSYIYKKPKSKLEVPPTFRFGNLNFAFLSTEEILMYEFSKLSVIRGANVLVNCSIGNISPHRYFEFRGIWSRCQQFKVCGINATMVGETPWGYSNLPSGLYGPIEFFKKGIIATAEKSSETELIIGKFGLEGVNIPVLEQSGLNKLMKTLKL